MRLFIGVPVPERFAVELARATQRVDLRAARRTSPENMHLTLVFLGEVAEERVNVIVRALADLDVTPFPMRITGFGAFERAGVLFAEVEPVARLLRLQAQVADRMADCGFVPEERPYHPHITLARFRSPVRLKVALPSQVKRSFRMEEVNLYRTRSTSGGSVYEVLARMQSKQ